MAEKNSLWKNIRNKAKQNRASGATPKKPTTEMLRQERKIRAQKAEGGPVGDDDLMLSKIYSKYPAFKNMGNITLKSDPSFTKEKTGLGEIEYFSPTQDTITYPTEYKYPHPNLGTHGIVYNPNINNVEESVRLDLLHGMPI
jgi:flagellar basal body rod protein FlgC